MSTNADIQRLIQAFAIEIEGLVRQAAIDSVEQALGGGAPRPKPAPARAPRVASTPARTSTPDVSDLDAAIVAFVKSTPDVRMEPMAKALRVDSSKLKPRMAQLLADGKLRKAGKARGTTYSAI